MNPKSLHQPSPCWIPGIALLPGGGADPEKVHQLPPLRCTDGGTEATQRRAAGQAGALPPSPAQDVTLHPPAPDSLVSDILTVLGLAPHSCSCGVRAPAQTARCTLPGRS